MACPVPVEAVAWLAVAVGGPAPPPPLFLLFLRRLLLHRFGQRACPRPGLPDKLQWEVSRHRLLLLRRRVVEHLGKVRKVCQLVQLDGLEGSRYGLVAVGVVLILLLDDGRWRRRCMGVTRWSPTPLQGNSL